MKEKLLKIIFAVFILVIGFGYSLAIHNRIKQNSTERRIEQIENVVVKYTVMYEFHKSDDYVEIKSIRFSNLTGIAEELGTTLIPRNRIICLANDLIGYDKHDLSSYFHSWDWKYQEDEDCNVKN